MRLTTGTLSRDIVTFLVPDNAFAADDVLHRLPLLTSIGNDNKKTLEKHPDKLYGADCSDIQPIVLDGGMWKVGHLMMKKLNHLHGAGKKPYFKQLSTSSKLLEITV